METPVHQHQCRNLAKHLGAIAFAALMSMSAVGTELTPAIARATTIEKDEMSSIKYRSIDVDGIKIFFREAGDHKKPTILLLHGFSSSSHMFRDLMPLLADDFHLVAPDYPGFGNSDAPAADVFQPTFANLEIAMEKFVGAVGIKTFIAYMQDFGGPVGLRMAAKHPEWINGLIIQNANAYMEGLVADKRTSNQKTSEQVVNPEFILFMYRNGVRNVAGLNPDAWTIDIAALQRPGAKAIQAALIDDYPSNLKKYPEWQSYFRKHQPKALVVWGKNDRAFSPAGAEGYRRDLHNIELHYFDTGHFALEEDAPDIARVIKGSFASQ
jgi:pimeloyl-ACP methyl ester carboxylesterase